VFTALLVALVLVDQIVPVGPDSTLVRRTAWLGAELVLCFSIVYAHGSLVRPTLIYLLPASRALFLFGERAGLLISLSIWVGFAANIGFQVWPDQLDEYPNYLAFLLGPYILGVVLTLAALRQSAARRHAEALYQDLRQAHQQLQMLHRQSQELAVTQERNRLAREIHDSIAHYLTIVNVQLEAAEKLGSEHFEHAISYVQRARRLTVECLQEVRSSVASLRAHTLEDFSLPRALQKLAAGFTESTGLPVQVQGDLSDSVPLAPEVSLALYRTAQEGLTNVEKHAQATSVHLVLSPGDEGIELVVQDDGIGPSGHGLPNRGGFGLLGLQERVELLGGHLHFGPAASSIGAVLKVFLPYHPEAK
ncbi:MAG TPA: sensor histidine kinase, partial [Dehalococcoidia bacterium]|nr:sensor histidine kinase [Dehalococcoidia bacterium]